MSNPPEPKTTIKTTVALLICNKPFCIEPITKCIDALRMPREEMMLLVVDVSANPRINEAMRAWCTNQKKDREWAQTLYVDSPQRDQVTGYVQRSNEELFMRKRWMVAESKNLVNSFRRGDLFLIEEDTLCPPGSYEKLRRILDEHPEAGAPTGVNYSRSDNSTLGDHTIWRFVSTRPFPFGDLTEQHQTTVIRAAEKPFGIECIGGSGNGCLLARADIMEGYRFVGNSTLSGMTGSDVNFGWYVTQLRRRLFVVDWSIKTKHIDQDKTMKVLEAYTSPGYGQGYDWSAN